MSLFDEEKPTPTTVHVIGSDLSLLSLEELDTRIQDLKIEITRLEAERIQKSAGRKAAESLFKF